jgi:hypothetical protein
MTETNELIKKVIESVIGGDEAAAEAWPARRWS